MAEAFGLKRACKALGQARKPAPDALAGASAWQFMLLQVAVKRLRILRVFLGRTSSASGARFLLPGHVPLAGLVLAIGRKDCQAGGLSPNVAQRT